MVVSVSDRLPAGARRCPRGRGPFPGHVPVLVRRAASSAGPRAGLAGSLALRRRLPHRPEGARAPIAGGRRERRVAKAAVETASDGIEHDELNALLHHEVNRLPAKYRARWFFVTSRAGRTKRPPRPCNGRWDCPQQTSRARDRLLSASHAAAWHRPDGWQPRRRDHRPGRVRGTGGVANATIAAAMWGTPAAAVTVPGGAHAQEPDHGTSQDGRGRSLPHPDDCWPDSSCGMPSRRRRNGPTPPRSR